MDRRHETPDAVLQVAESPLPDQTSLQQFSSHPDGEGTRSQ